MPYFIREARSILLGLFSLVISTNIAKLTPLHVSCKVTQGMLSFSHRSRLGLDLGYSLSVLLASSLTPELQAFGATSQVPTGGLHISFAIDDPLMREPHAHRSLEQYI
jgi:hypothetical protein